MHHTCTIDGRILPLRFTRGDLAAAELASGVKLYGPGAEDTWGALAMREGETPEQFAERFTGDPGTSFKLAVVLFAAIGEAGRKKYPSVERLINAFGEDEEGLFVAGSAALEAATDFFRALTARQALIQKAKAAQAAPATTTETVETEAVAV